MKSHRVSDSARMDLDGIWDYIAQDDPETADRFVRLLLAKFVVLATMPQLERRREEFAPGLRSFPVGKCVIFYRSAENGVVIIRVLHGARDLPSLFE